MLVMFINEILGDFNLILMIFTFITIANFIRNHLGDGPASWVAMITVAGVVFLSGYWPFFGGIFTIYMLLMMGVSTLIIDFFFVAPRPGQKQGTPMSSGVDLGTRINQMQKQRGAGSVAGRFGPR